MIKQGYVPATNYLEEVKFDYYNDFIFIKTKINDKEYNFLFDTGWDLTAISPEILKHNPIKNTGISNVSEDAAHVEESFEYLLLDEISIGNVNFKDIAVFQKDFAHFQKMLGCVEFDGIIGNNLIRKAKWEINYDKQIIKITNDISRLLGNESTIEIPLKTGNYGQADIVVQLNDHKEKFTFDTGFNGKFTSDYKLFKKINLSEKHYTIKTGFTGMQANGETDGISYVTLMNTFNLGNLNLKDQMVHFEKNQSSLIGNGFFENYVVIIDWDDKRLHLKQSQVIVPDSLVHYPYLFGPNYIENKLVFYNQYTEHQTTFELNKNIEILKINNINVSGHSTEDLCKLWKELRKELGDEIQMVILDNGIEKKISLRKRLILPKGQ